MARKKVKLVWIQNDSARRATFKKRRKGLMKKVSELSTLCDIKACALVFSPYDAVPEIWPPDSQEVMKVLGRFRSMPEMEQSKKMLNQEGFLRSRIGKVRGQLKKMEVDNREAELTLLMIQCMGGGRHIGDLSIDEMIGLERMLDAKLKIVHERIESVCTSTTRTVTTPPVRQQQHRLNGVGVGVGPPPGHMDTVGGMLANELHNLDSALEIFKRQDHNMFMCSPQLILPTVDEVPLHSYIDGGAHLPTLYPDNNTSWLDDNYFHS